MSSKLQVKRSAVAGKVPATTDLDLGELAVNTYDGKLFIKKSVSGVESIIEIGSGGGGGTGIGVEELTYALDGLGGDSASYTYNGTGLLTNISDNIFGLTRSTTLAYNTDNSISTVTVAYSGVTSITTYIYTGGNITGYTRSIT